MLGKGLGVFECAGARGEKERWSPASDSIIRPHRHEYEIEDLGPSMFRVDGVAVQRHDLQLSNCQGEILECSYFEPLRDRSGSSPFVGPCVIYLHGNSSSRLE